ncbi:hypothetical protein Q8A73_017590 [Channa argus]|nr:hypothetical protein Q8A73_017590 [Channa argus]
MDEPLPGSTQGQSQEALIGWDDLWTSKHPSYTPLYSIPHALDRSCDGQSYVQTNTGALIRLACSSTNPGILGAVLPLPKDQLPQGDTDPMDLMSTPRGCLGAMVESKVFCQR